MLYVSSAVRTSDPKKDVKQISISEHIIQARVPFQNLPWLIEIADTRECLHLLEGPLRSAEAAHPWPLPCTD